MKRTISRSICDKAMLSVANSQPLANKQAPKKQNKHHRHRPRAKSLRTATTTTPPVIAKGPTLLDHALRDLKCYDESDDAARLVALDYLEKILARWALTLRTITTNSNSTTTTTSNNPWQRPRVALVSFGSYCLGVHGKSSDLDVLAIAPPSCTREDFFTSLVRLLREDSSAEQVHPIPQAYTPVIKFVLKGFQIDMLFARVADATKLLDFQRKRVSPLVIGVSKPQTGLPRVEYPIDDSDLMELDEAGVRSVNGARVSQMLLQIVPHVENYRTVLKAVKQWATEAGIYSNVLGFLGGINWAILVAWVCMRHPMASNNALLESFFRTFATWKWPEPVLLAPIQDTPPPGVVPLPAWNPNVNPRDGLHICPIITPAYPSMNSSYNVGMPQLRRIQDEMILACNHLKETHHNDYASLFLPSDFFSRHEHYLQVTIRASNRQDFVEWFRLVESRLRLLISSIETQQVHAWPFARFFDRQYDKEGFCLGPGKTQDENAVHESLFFIALRFAPGLDTVNLRHLTSDFLFKVNTWEKRNAGMDLQLEHITSADLPSFVLVKNSNNESSSPKNNGNGNNNRRSGGGNKSNSKPKNSNNNKNKKKEPQQQKTNNNDTTTAAVADDSSSTTDTAEDSKSQEQPGDPATDDQNVAPPNNNNNKSPCLSSPYKKCRVTAE